MTYEQVIIGHRSQLARNRPELQIPHLIPGGGGGEPPSISAPIGRREKKKKWRPKARHKLLQNNFGNFSFGGQFQINRRLRLFISRRCFFA